GPGRDLEFDTSHPARELTARCYSDLRSAASWLQQMVVIDFMASAVCCCPAVSDNQQIPSSEMIFVLFFAVALLLYLPLIFVALGAHYLRTRRRHGVAMAGGVVALLVSVETFAQSAFSVLAGAEWGNRRGLGCMLFVLAAMALYGSIAGLIGGIKTLVV